MEDNSNVRIYSIISYIGILWIVGLFVKEKDDKSLKFHVGQGMLLSIFGAIFSTIVNFVSSFIRVFWHFTFPEVSNIFVFLATFGFILIFLIIRLIFMIIGIKNASDGRDEYLPIIGKFALYK